MLVHEPSQIIPPSRALVPAARTVSLRNSLLFGTDEIAFELDARPSHFGTPCLIAQGQPQMSQRLMAEAVGCYTRALGLRTPDITSIKSVA